MRMLSVVAVSLLVLVSVSQAGAQGAQDPGSAQSFAPVPSGQAIPAPQGKYPSPGYGLQPQAQPQPTTQYQQSGTAASQGEWPYYPYPPYHNPYYEQRMSARDAFSGTIDWLLAFPSSVMDRIGNFLDGRVFPQAPAAQGTVPAVNHTPGAPPDAGAQTALPQAETVAPVTR
jgi:hypothetical protein